MDPETAFKTYTLLKMFVDAGIGDRCPALVRALAGLETFLCTGTADVDELSPAIRDSVAFVSDDAACKAVMRHAVEAILAQAAGGPQEAAQA